MQTYFDNGIVQLYQADAREIPLPEQSVHCVVTSPPYYGLRVYQDNCDRGIGLEASVEAYVANLVDVFSEVRRVLRDDGVCWVNLGDSYATNSGTNGMTGGLEGFHKSDKMFRDKPISGLEAGNRLGIPERVVMALQSDGWIWRDTVIWAKKSAMPESVNGWRFERCRVKVARVRSQSQAYPIGAGRGDGDNSGGIDKVPWNEYTDCPGCPKCADNKGLVLRRGSWRTTSSHEYIYMLTKGMGYYCDAEAVKTAHVNGWKGSQFITGKTAEYGLSRSSTLRRDEPTGANRRSVWNDISPEPYSGAHFATFPSDLPRICIQASTSERGVCPECGNQWARVVEAQHPGDLSPDNNMETGRTRNGMGGQKEWDDRIAPRNIGWRATCDHAGNPVPATVLDPFAGTATTCLAAQKLGRKAVGTDISEAYLKQAVQRLLGVSLPLLDL